MRIRRSQTPRHPGRRRTQPLAEGLESRMLLYSTLGAQWTYGSRITFSFAPDGTNVAGAPSSWFQAMSSRGISVASWQEQFAKAASVWEAVANINLVPVSDDGSPISTSGYQQGDGRFGDIRIAGIPQGAGTLAMAFYPPPINGGTLAGDIVMNTAQAWQVNNDYDIMTVAVHEFGHALGLDHSLISQAVMYAAYTGKKQTLNSDDTAGIQSIYSARQDDAFEPNNVVGASKIITPYLDAQGRLTISSLDINSAYDRDWFYVVAPASTTGTMTAKVQSTNLSLLSPRVTVYNSSLVALAQDSRPLTYGDTAQVTITGVQPGQGFFILASAATTGPTGSGAYGLQVNFGNSYQAPVPPPYTVVPSQPSRGGGGGGMSLDIGLAVGPAQVGGFIDAYVNGRIDVMTMAGLAAQLGYTSLDAYLEENGVVQIGSFRGYGDALTTSEIGDHGHGPAPGGGVITAAPVLDAWHAWHPFLTATGGQEPDASTSRPVRKALHAFDLILDRWSDDAG
jgi:predicted Zn-dependent protease